MVVGEEIAPIYRGSVKDVYASGENLLFHFSDDFSVFDWGKMPDRIEGKGRSLALFAASVFEQLDGKLFADLPNSRHLKHFDSKFLQDLFGGDLYKKELAVNGMSSHYRGLNWGGRLGKVSQYLEAFRSGETDSEPLYLEVDKALVQRPELRQIGGESVYFYPAAENAPLRFIPLEIVFRFGVPQGSSLLSRLAHDPALPARLGLSLPSSEIKAGVVFDRPVIEFFTKLESSDRLLSYQEASLISGLSATAFHRLYQTAQFVSLALYHLFAEAGGQNLHLLDGKVEAAYRQADGAIVLADSVGPDELRLSYNGVQLSKEALRLYYRQTDWFNKIEAAKKEVRPHGVTWQKVMKERGDKPPALPADLKETMACMYKSLALGLVGIDEAEKQSRFSLPSLSAIASKLEKL